MKSKILLICLFSFVCKISYGQDVGTWGDITGGAPTTTSHDVLLDTYGKYSQTAGLGLNYVYSEHIVAGWGQGSGWLVNAKYDGTGSTGGPDKE